MLIRSHVAQGLLRLLLNETEAAKAMDCARMAGRYLTPFEVSRLIKRELTKTIQDNEVEGMERCWLEFCKANDIAQDAGVTNIDVLEKWWPFAAANYHEPLPSVSKGTIDWAQL